MTRVLCTVLGPHEDAVRRARREIGYDHLVLFTPEREHDAVERIHRVEALAGSVVRVVEVDPNDLLDTLHRMDAVVQDHDDDEVSFQVNAGDNRLTHPAILTCFRHGLDAWFCTERGSQRLPVLRAVRLEERFTKDERVVLPCLEGPLPVDRVVDLSGLEREAAMGALLELKRKGLLDVDGQVVQLNDVGAYYRDHLRRMAAPGS